MPQNAPQCPTPADDHDTLSPSPKGTTDAPSPQTETPVGEGWGEGSSAPQDEPSTPAAPPPASLASSPLLPNDPPPPTPQDTPQLTDRQRLVIDFLVLGHTETVVAEALHVDRKTLYRWRRDDPDYRAALEDRRKELLDTTADRFRTMLAAALDTFARHLADPYAPTAHRAARSLLALAAIGRHHEPRPTPTPKLPSNVPPMPGVPDAHAPAKRSDILS